MHGADFRGKVFPRIAEQAGIESLAVDIAPEAGADRPARKQLLIILELEVAHRRAGAGRRHPAVECLADQGCDRHRRNQRPVIAFGQEMPGSFNRPARLVRPFDLDEHAAAMLAPGEPVGRPVHQRRQRRQRWDPAGADQPGQADQGAVQHFRHRPRAHPDRFCLGPQRRQRVEVRHVDQREQRVPHRHAPGGRDGVPHLLGERITLGRPAIAHQPDRPPGIARNGADDVLADPGEGRWRDAAADALDARHLR